MIFTRYVDISLGDDKFLENIKIETDIPKEEILTISPMLTNYGGRYRNITLLSDRYGNQYKVIGNYKDIILEVRGNNTNKIIGF